MRLRIFLLSLLSLAIAWPAAAQTPQEIWKMCFGPTTARTIAACTTIIDARDAYPVREVAIAYRNRGLGYRAKGQNERALRDYDESIRTDPGYVESYISRGNVYVDRNENDRALQDFDEALRLRPGFIFAIHNAATRCSARASSPARSRPTTRP